MTEHLIFTSQLCNAIRKLHISNYFSHLSGTIQARHWGLIDSSLKLTDKGRQFAEGKIAIEREIVVTPQKSSESPNILRGDSFIFIDEYDSGASFHAEVS